MVMRRPADLHVSDEVGRRDGLAYTLWLPDGPARGAVVVLHGAGSAKESHHDFARAAQAVGLATVCFDARGHGDSDGPMRAEPLDDVARMAELLRERLGDSQAPIGLRGSSMGGCFALLAAGRPDVAASAVVAICPASPDGLRRGVAAGTLGFAADVAALDGFLATQDLNAAVAGFSEPVLLLHAEGDEVVPVELSRDLASRLQHPDSRLVTVPGGHHRSVQHDPELQALSVRFLRRALG